MRWVVRMEWMSSVLLPCLLLMLLRAAAAQRDPALKCGACLALVDEMNNVIRAVDPKKTIQVGSFRVDSHGNQDLREIPYARSESHLVEAFETVCGRMNSYAESEYKDGKVYIRTSSYDGQPVSLKKVSISGEIHKKLKIACEAVVEDYEEEMTDLFKQSAADIEEKICVEVTELCDKSDVENKMWAYAEAVMEGMQEKMVDEDEDEGEDDEDNDQESDAQTDSDGSEKDEL